jgi:flagellar biosynthesis GTPase FlhF
MVEAKTVFGGEAEKRAYVESCEAGYEAALDDAVARVVANPDCRIITLTGPTCSGKTTTARKLI